MWQSTSLALSISTQLSHMASRLTRDATLLVNLPLLVFAPLPMKILWWSFITWQMNYLHPHNVMFASPENAHFACLLRISLDTQGIRLPWFGTQNKNYTKTISLAILWKAEPYSSQWHILYKDLFTAPSYLLECRWRLRKRISILHSRPSSVSLNNIDAELPSDIKSFRTQNCPPISSYISALSHNQTRWQITGKVGVYLCQVLCDQLFSNPKANLHPEHPCRSPRDLQRIIFSCFQSLKVTSRLVVDSPFLYRLPRPPEKHLSFATQRSI